MFEILEHLPCYNTLTSRVENNVDPNQLTSLKPADMDEHCFQNMIYCGEAWSHWLGSM